ncbi:hypothetical protein [Dyella mobilis]|uniref:Right handed beta helix region n=1 Tax=Dyella mobilis TaxID=1849582 RepID=A0ABS2KJX6_9GAMM|nr:hypothetical protein [Dyella mobilis]MBM7131239.1 hypothetical protein [Dyella mobilis]GLQ98824.1 hypothetical protein GCM10007863_32440 [Dyella mobilis]
MSVTSDFSGSPQTWIMTHRFVTPTASYIGAAGALATGNGSFRFEDAGAGGGGNLLKPAGWKDLLDYFNAFYLGATPNQNNNIALSNQNSLFLTADLSGCQFLAYGPDRNNLTVEHNNFFAGGNAAYVARYNLIQGAGHAVFIALRPSAIATQQADEYYIIEGANIIGVKKADGWHFYARTRTDRAFGPTREL